MPQYVITPWKHHSELLQVRREMYQLGEASPPVDLRRHAVDWVAAWKMRGNLPHAVESTALLVDSILHHDATKNSTFSIRATYCAAFCRFVTGFCDISQNFKNKRSMYDVAREIDMPASFVELRHEATHEELPSMKRLMRNAELALDWLWQFYWAKLDEETKSSESGFSSQIAASKPQISTILDTFMTRRRIEIKSGTNATLQTSASGIACLDIVKLCLGNKGLLEVVAETLLEEKMLVPASRTIGSSMKGAFVIWGNLLRRLTNHQKRFCKTFTEQMVQIITRPSHLDLKLDTFREAIYEWLLHIFSAKEWIAGAISDRVLDLRGFVVSECIESSPNCWSGALAQKLVKSGDAEFREQWLPVIDELLEG